MSVIDLRSDTVTQPTAAMRAAMAAAPVGDDVYGEDPTVNALQQRLAESSGSRRGLFVPTGTQSNLLALMAHCERGDEYIVGMEAHTYKYEGGGAAVLGSIQPQPIVQGRRRHAAAGRLEAAIKPTIRISRAPACWHWKTPGMAASCRRTTCRRAHDLARDRGLGMHLDGARFFNAVVASGSSPREMARHFDTVSVCLSKGLGAPVGSVLVGSHALIDSGPALAQGAAAAACARRASSRRQACMRWIITSTAWPRTMRAPSGSPPGCGQIDGIDLLGRHTNMVFIDVPVDRLEALDAHLREAGVRISIGYTPRVRLVTHLDVDDAASNAPSRSSPTSFPEAGSARASAQGAQRDEQGDDGDQDDRTDRQHTPVQAQVAGLRLDRDLLLGHRALLQFERLLLDRRGLAGKAPVVLVEPQLGIADLAQHGEDLFVVHAGSPKSESLWRQKS